MGMGKPANPVIQPAFWPNQFKLRSNPNQPIEIQLCSIWVSDLTFWTYEPANPTHWCDIYIFIYIFTIDI